jgi:propanol-preferring alcohol dehydrogenase
VSACGVCRTDLHIRDKELPSPKLPLILGHEIVGVVAGLGKNVKKFSLGDRVGVSWLAKTCGTCSYCKSQQENLCDHPLFTGYTRDGGFAEYTVCHADYAFSLPNSISDSHAAPLLCSGMIGYRAYRKAAAEKKLGIYGFGAAAHILTQLARYQGKQVYAFTRPGDAEGQHFARKLGAVWAGSSEEDPPEKLDAAILFAPAGELAPRSLRVLKKGGRCICGGIHMSDIPSFPYRDLWEEKSIHSVANLTREDGRAFLQAIAGCPLHTHITTYPLEQANEALDALKHGAFQGAAVLSI